MPGPVGDAVVQMADAGDVLLVVGAGRDDIVRLACRRPSRMPCATASPPARRARSSSAAPPSRRGFRSRISAARASAGRGWRSPRPSPRAMSSSSRKRRSMVSRHESGTLGEGRPGRKSSVWPPWIELMFMVERRAPSGTTGMRVCLRSSAGNSSSSKASSTAPMWRTAQSPRNGIEPCAISPLVSISAHQTPRWPRQMRSLLSGSGMMTWSTRGFEK